MNLRLLGIALAVASPCFATANSETVRVQFDHSEKFTDLSLSGSTTDGVQKHIMSELAKFLSELGDHALAPGHTLNVTFLNIDMAGAEEPWRTPTLTHTRFIREVYPPRMEIKYLWRDAKGKVIAEKQETFTDLSYLQIADPYYTYNDPLRYEKAMIRRRFNERFAIKSDDRNSEYRGVCRTFASIPGKMDIS